MLVTQPIEYRSPDTGRSMKATMPVYGTDENPPGVWEEFAIGLACGFGCKVYRDRITETLAVMHNSNYGCRQRAAREYDDSATKVEGTSESYVDGEGNEFYRVLIYSATGCHGWRRHYTMRHTESYSEFMRRTSRIPFAVKNNF